MPSLIRKHFHVIIVVPKIQETLLYGTRRDAKLEPCIVQSIPFFPLIPMMS